jgi:dTDP-4-dehydrorhamnose reductase
MNILVTGCNGQLGSEIRELSPEYKNCRFLFTDVMHLDITQYEQVEKYIENKNIDCIINCAAYTAVDKAESEPEKAYEINVKAVANLVRISKRNDIILVHISTDYVFDGKNYMPYTESDKTNPLSVYGRTKLQGEQEVISNAGKAIIIRTSWLYSSFGNNFVKSIIKFAKERGKLNVVYDQIGTPTYARDLAGTILDIIQSADSIHKSVVEIYHYSNEGVCSWYDFAELILEESNIKCELRPVESKDYPTPVTRPHYSVLNKNKIKDHFKIQIPYWRDSAIKCLKAINN